MRDLIRSVGNAISKQWHTSRNFKEPAMLKCRRLLWCIAFALKALRCGIMSLVYGHARGLWHRFEFGIAFYLDNWIDIDINKRLYPSAYCSVDAEAIK